MYIGPFGPWGLCYLQIVLILSFIPHYHTVYFFSEVCRALAEPESVVTEADLVTVARSWRESVFAFAVKSKTFCQHVICKCELCWREAVPLIP